MRYLFIILTLLSISSAHAQFAQWDWVKYGYCYSSYDNSTYGNSIFVDAAHNTYVLGNYDDMHIDTFDLTHLSVQQSMALVKYDAGGNLVWLRTATYPQAAYSGILGNYGNSVNVDSAGNIYIGGEFSDTLDLGGIKLYSDSNSIDIFMAKYDADGNIIWAKKAGGAGSDMIGSGIYNNGEGSGMRLDNYGHIYLTGIFGNGVGAPTVSDFDTVHIISDTSGNSFVAKYDTGGHALWVKKIGPGIQPISLDIAVDRMGNVFCTGSSSGGTTIFDTIKISMGKHHPYGYMFLVKYDQNGSVLWARGAGGNGGTTGFSLVTDKAGNVIVTGDAFNDTTVFDSIVLPQSGKPNNNFNSNGFLAKYSSSGNIMWAKYTDASYLSQSSPNYMSIDSNDELYLVGSFKDTCTFDNKTMISNGDYDGYIAMYSDDGYLDWLTSFGGSLDDHGYGITADNTGAVYITGVVRDTCAFGSYSITGNTSNMFVAKVTTPALNASDIVAPSTISIYPNPASSTITVDPGKTNFNDLHITDPSGRIVYAQPVTRGKMTINVNTLIDGLYFVTMDGKEGSICQKLVVQH